MSRAGLVAAASRYDSKGPTDRTVEGEKMLVDREQGMRVSELCSKYNVSQATLYRRLDDALAARIVPTVDAYRERMNVALDEQMRRWEQQVEGAEAIISQGTTSESLAVVERGMAARERALLGMLRVLERRAKLNGLDAPVRVDVQVSSGAGVESRVAELLGEVKSA